VHAQLIASDQVLNWLPGWLSLAQVFCRWLAIGTFFKTSGITSTSELCRLSRIILASE
jgi:hypothetical protein